MKEKFKPIDIEDLRSQEFKQLAQGNMSVEQLGLKLQKLARHAFPRENSYTSRLLKIRFYQALLPFWKKKLGAPKWDETFEQLFHHTHAAERHKQQFREGGKQCSCSEKVSGKGTVCY